MLDTLSTHVYRYNPAMEAIEKHIKIVALERRKGKGKRKQERSWEDER